MNVKQISVFLDDAPGSLAGLAEVLHKNDVDMRALSVADAKDFGVVRMLVDNNEAALPALEDAGYVCMVNDVVAVEVDDSPGGLYKLLKALGDANVNVDYSYMLATSKSGKAYMIARVDDVGRALQSLEADGWRCLQAEDIPGV